MTLQILLFLLLIRKILSYNLDVNNPIIYENPEKQSRVSYFGLSVLIRPEASLLFNTPLWYLQIGSPRSNISSVEFKEPGCVYRCGTYGSCEKYNVDPDESGAGGYGVYKFVEKKDEAFIGMSMDMKETKSPRFGEKIVICGHRWSNQHRANPENIALTYLMTGVCYLQDVLKSNLIGTEKYQKLLPLINQNNIYTPKPFNFQTSVYNWGIGQMGTSVELADDLASVLMGAPGIYNWRGSVVHYSVDHKAAVVANFENFKFSYAYIGYQVGSGKFFGDDKLWFVASAPRSGDYHGQVIIFQIQDPSGKIKIATTLLGSTFGEYFGASFAISDINSDGKDDIIVGAPSYSFREPEEGRIYVFLGTTRDSYLLVHSQVIPGKIGHSRFGTCISSIGDLDQDGYNDVAVGAPYENDNRGAVYIYHGYSKGLQTQYSQKIKASDVYDGLRGFGISISKGVDVDKNLYRDIAVGSYLSDQVVLLRSRPIVSLHPHIEHEIKLLDRRAVFFNVTVCSKYLGANVGELNVSRGVKIDPNYGRAKILPSWSWEETTSVLLNFNQTHCEELHLLLDPQAMNRTYSIPIEIFLSNELFKCGEGKKILTVGNTNHQGEDAFSPWCPLGSSSETSIKVPFAGECGADNICKADLDIFCSISEASNNFYVIGTTKHINLNIKLKNRQEPAYDARINVQSNLNLMETENNFYQNWEINENFAKMAVDTFFGAHFEREFNLEISTEQIQQRKFLGDYLNVTVKASTSSGEDVIDNNECEISVKLICDIQVELYASSSPGIISFSETQENQIINLTHYYEVRKIGESPANDAELFIYVPTHYSGIEIVNVGSENSEWMYSSRMENEITDLNRIEGYNPETTPLVSTESPPFNRTLFLNCSTPKVQCTVLQTTFPDGIPAGISSFSKVFVNFNFSAIEPFMGKNDIVQFTTNAVLKVPQHFSPDPVILHANTSSTFFVDQKSRPLDLYVIALSVLGGGLLLSLIISALFKGNFFKRTKKEELEVLKQQEMFETQQKPMIQETDC